MSEKVQACLAHFYYDREKHRRKQEQEGPSAGSEEGDAYVATNYSKKMIKRYASFY